MNSLHHIIQSDNKTHVNIQIVVVLFLLGFLTVRLSAENLLL